MKNKTTKTKNNKNELQEVTLEIRKAQLKKLKNPSISERLGGAIQGFLFVTIGIIVLGGGMDGIRKHNEEVADAKVEAARNYCQEVSNAIKSDDDTIGYIPYAGTQLTCKATVAAYINKFGHGL